MSSLAGDSQIESIPDINRLRILLIDDCRDDFVIIEEQLSSIPGMSLDLDWVSTYAAARRALSARDHDVYLVDYNLGRNGDSGIDLIREAKALGCPAPFIVLTGSDSRWADMNAMQAGAIDYLVKGKTDASLLERAIRYSLAQTATLEALRRSESALQSANEQLTARVSELEQLTHEMSQLTRLGQLLHNCMTSEEVARAVARLAEELFPDCAGVLYEPAPPGDLLYISCAWGAPTIGQEPFSSTACCAVQAAQTCVSAGGEPCCVQMAGVQGDAICVPLVAHGQLQGLFHLHRGEARDDTGHSVVSEAQLRLAVSVADQAALTLANLNLRERLRRQAVRDPLTGLYNRRYMEESLARELRRCERSRRPVGLLLIDVDHFKQINDTYGHPAGDRVLQALAELFGHSVRGGDIVCRFGGEEFVIILTDAPEEVVVRRGEVLREQVRRLAVQEHGRLLPPISVSIGTAFFPQHGKSAEQLLASADIALYSAKQSGRDRLVVADRLPEQ